MLPKMVMMQISPKNEVTEKMQMMVWVGCIQWRRPKKIPHKRLDWN